MWTNIFVKNCKIICPTNMVLHCKLHSRPALSLLLCFSPYDRLGKCVAPSSQNGQAALAVCFLGAGAPHCTCRRCQGFAQKREPLRFLVAALRSRLLGDCFHCPHCCIFICSCGNCCRAQTFAAASAFRSTAFYRGLLSAAYHPR